MENLKENKIKFLETMNKELQDKLNKLQYELMNARNYNDYWI